MVLAAWTKADFTFLTRDLPSMYFHAGSWILNTFAVRIPLVPLIESPLAFWLTLNQHSIDILVSGQLILDAYESVNTRLFINRMFIECQSRRQSSDD